MFFGGKGHGVGDYEGIDRAFGEPLGGFAVEKGVGAGGYYLLCAQFPQGVGRAHYCAGGVYHVVYHYDILALDLAYHIHDFGNIGLGAALIYDRHGYFEHFRHGAGTLHTAHIRSNHDHVAQIVIMALDIFRNQRLGLEAIHGYIEKALYLVGVQIHGNHPVRPRLIQKIRHQLCRDGYPCLVLSILTGIAVIGDYGVNPACGSPL